MTMAIGSNSVETKSVPTAATGQGHTATRIRSVICTRPFQEFNLSDSFRLHPQCRMSDYAACILCTQFRKQFDGDMHQVVLIFRGIVRSFKGLAEITATDRLA